MTVSLTRPPPLERVDPRDVGLDADQLAHIDRHLQRAYIDPAKIAGCLTLVARAGRIAHLSCLGSMDRERRRPLHEDTIFRIYSMTKPITSVALMQLYEQGRFQLADPVAKLIPEWRSLRVFRDGRHPGFVTDAATRPMTIRDLLSHQSGLTYDFLESTPLDAAYRELGVGRGRDRSLRHMIEQLAELPLLFSPGERWNYSLATDVCGYLVEVLSGQPFDQYLREHVLGPLSMNDTGFAVSPDQADRFGANYQRAADKSLELLDDPQISPFLEEPTFFSGGGGLVSTAADYLRFCQMLLAGGELDGRRILGRKTIELMTMNHLPDDSDLAARATGTFSETTYDGVGFGLGFAMVRDLARAQTIGSVGEYFWGGAASTIFWIDPAEELVVIFLTQLMPSGTFNFRGQLKAIVYPALLS